MSYSAVPGSPGTTFASGHPATRGNLGIIRTEDAGQTWVPVADGLDGPSTSTTWRSAGPTRQ